MKHTQTLLLLTLAFAPAAQARSVAGRPPAPAVDSEGQPFVFRPEAVGLGDDAALQAVVADPNAGRAGEAVTPPPSTLSSVAGIPAYNPSWGISTALYQKAVSYLQAHPNTFTNNRYVVMVDMRNHAGTRRFLVFDRQTSSVEAHNTSHGSGSDPKNTGKARYFSNRNGSLMTSVGVYKTGATFHWRSHPEGPSMRLHGLENTNSAALARGILIHPAGYVRDGGRSGRSWGCLALDPRQEARIVQKLGKGAMIVVEQ